MAKRKTKSRSKKKQQPAISKWLWIVTILLIGGLITFLLYITRSKPIEEKPSYPVSSTPPAGSEKPKPKFEFYEMLPSKQVKPAVTQKPKEPVQQAPAKPAETTSPATAPTKAKPEAPAEPKPAAKQFFLQVGSFSKFDDADQLKAELTLLGFPVIIQSVNTEGNLLFRVRSGPFTDKNAALAAEMELKSYDITGQLISE